ncbi:single-stranded DNA-binding protein [Macrococcus caseolyticus]|uniref:single-stranded DNA-binding protein n=1 Tax=Macrococcoides caseolyticum TaxID=69966 RepID=UPI002DBFC091|nr:single-stranded DNA-binding protein [Macrococcus caseolyticus]MEB8172187.1 single-stranded DNA-binding protein [Macrococcus caseolyticus]
MINRVVLTGRLTKDPEFRVTTSGVSVATFTLAVNRMFSNDQGEKQADFINCVTFRKQAENVNNFLSKGSLVGVDGRLQSRSYDNKEGQRVYVTEVICDSVQFLEPKNSQNQQNNGVQQPNHTQTNNNNQNNQNVNRGQNNANNGYSQQHENPFANSTVPIDVSDDSLPF